MAENNHLYRNTIYPTLAGLIIVTIALISYSITRGEGFSGVAYALYGGLPASFILGLISFTIIFFLKIRKLEPPFKGKTAIMSFIYIVILPIPLSFLLLMLIPIIHSLYLQF